MCYSLAGRVQTRLVSLAPPTLLAAVLVWRTGDQRYATMLVVMVAVALDLDIVLYSRLFAYQARWQTYLLGLGEFFVTLAAVRVLGGTLPLDKIIAFYVPSWIGAQLIVNAALPVLDPLWVEHGGELGRPAVPRPRVDGFVNVALDRFRRYLVGSASEAFSVASLLFLLFLELTVVPGALSPLDALAATVGALAVWIAAGSGFPARVPGFRWRWPPGSSVTAGEIVALGLAVSLLVRGAPWIYLVAGVTAAGCRCWLRLGNRPLFNSAACAIAGTVLFLPGAYAADAQWGNSLFLPLVVANLAVVTAFTRSRLTLLATFACTLLLHGLVILHPGSDWLQAWLPEVFPASLLFFAGFVLTERVTTPEARAAQAVMGLGCAAGGLFIQHLGAGLPFVAAVLMWNYGAWLSTVLTKAFRKIAGHPANVEEQADVSSLAVAPGVSRRTFLGAATALAGSALLGAAGRRLVAIDPAVLSLPPDPVLAGGQEIPTFRDVAGPAGIALTHHADPDVGSPAVGTGAAWGDFDMDGRLDLYVTDQMGASHLYRNNGDGTFTDVAAQAGVAHPSLRATSATFVDYDNDGWPDLYVGVAHGPNKLYHNNGDGTFTDVSASSGLADQLGRTMSTAWADYDGDGFLDVFVVNYPSEPVSFDGNTSITENIRTVNRLARPHNRLYHNNGDGTFTDVTHLLGDIGAKATRGFGFSAVWFDYNRDGRPDLYVAYDFGGVIQPNTLWRNDGPGGPRGWRFTEVQNALGVAAQGNTMGVASGDYNNDGWQDLAVSNIGPNFLYRNHSGRSFQNIAERAGVAHPVETVDNMFNPSMTWGLSFADFNNDGWLDLYLVAGAMDFEHIPQPNSLYLNDRAGGFVDVSGPSGAADPGQGRSLAIADYDGDGRLDMFVANYGQPPLLYRNLSRSTGNHWIRLELEGTLSNRDAVGARVTVFAHDLPPQTREVQIGQGLGSCDAKALHFGLGSASRADRIDIRWPSGRTQTLRRVPADQSLTVREPGASRWPERKAPAVL